MTEPNPTDSKGRAAGLYPPLIGEPDLRPWGVCSDRIPSSPTIAERAFTKVLDAV